MSYGKTVYLYLLYHDLKIIARELAPVFAPALAPVLTQDFSSLLNSPLAAAVAAGSRTRMWMPFGLDGDGEEEEGALAGISAMRKAISAYFPILL